jgi:hypothetical protein
MPMQSLNQAFIFQPVSHFLRDVLWSSRSRYLLSWSLSSLSLSTLAAIQEMLSGPRFSLQPYKLGNSLDDRRPSALTVETTLSEPFPLGAVVP